METKVKENGQAKVASTGKADKKAPRFVAGNPVNKVSQKAEEKKAGAEAESSKGTLTDKSAIRPAVPLKEKDNSEASGNSNAEAETVRSTTAKTEKQPKKAAKTPTVNEEPKAELTKAELREALQEQKPAMNLEATIKLALDLNRRINQRGKLLETIETLEKFEVAQKDDAEETDSNHFQGCVLTIEDDKNREFTTKNPFIINAVAQMVNKLCVDKLAEIEGEIFIPVK